MRLDNILARLENIKTKKKVVITKPLVIKEFRFEQEYDPKKFSKEHIGDGVVVIRRNYPLYCGTCRKDAKRLFKGQDGKFSCGSKIYHYYCQRCNALTTGKLGSMRCRNGCTNTTFYRKTIKLCRPEMREQE